MRASTIQRSRLPLPARNEAITLAFCWAHLRRRFYDIAEGGPAPIASEALARIAALYAIEKTIRGRSADERRAHAVAVRERFLTR